ncbi:MAG: hypothetical protein ACOYOE_00415 [Chlorobium sp.]
MAYSTLAWFSTTSYLAPFLKKSLRPNSPQLEKLNTEITGTDAHKSSSRVLSPEEEIIIQMAKEYPALFIT